MKHKDATGGEKIPVDEGEEFVFCERDELTVQERAEVGRSRRNND